MNNYRYRQFNSFNMPTELSLENKRVKIPQSFIKTVITTTQ
jgi:hypothetical protein